MPTPPPSPDLEPSPDLGPSPDLEPSPDLGDLLMRAVRGLRHRWAQSLEPWDLSPHHARALQVVGDLDHPRLGTVAERLRIAPRSATEVVDALEERGLVERVPDATDRRAICVALTDQGRHVLAEVDAARGSSGAEHFAALTPRQRRELAELLKLLDRRPHPPE